MTPSKWYEEIMFGFYFQPFNWHRPFLHRMVGYAALDLGPFTLTITWPTKGAV